nr:nucleotide-binding alpha-beta plait domain-containing protein [Tanacetum cinerariifolium]
MSVVYVLTNPIPDDGDDAIVDQLRKRAKWDNDNYVCSCLILNGSHLRIEEFLRMQDSDKPKGNNVAGPSVVNIVEYSNSSRYNDNKVKGGKAGNKANGSGTNGLVDGSTNSLKGETVHVCKDRCWFKTYEPLNDGSILYMRNESTALVHGRGCVDLNFSYGKIVPLYNVLHVPNIRKNLVASNVLTNCGYKQSLDQLRIPNETKDIGGSVVPEEVTEEDDPKTFDEAMKSQDVAFLKEAINDEMDFIRSNNNVKTAFMNGDLDEEVDLTKEFLSLSFFMNDMGEADVILALASNSAGTELLKENHGLYISYTGYPSVLKGYTDASWISNTEGNSSTSGWVFLLGGGAISWAYKKQNCITGLTIESKFMALAAAVDAFIPDRRSKIGKKFGFIRFIKVFDAERLVNNLCTVWIGSHRLHANIARFQRPTGQNNSRNFGHNGEKRKDDKGNNGNFNSYAHVLKGVSHPNGDTTNTPSLVIGDDCVNQEDYSCCINGKVKEFGSLSNLKVVLGNECFNEIEIRYLEGLWVMLVFRSVDGKEKFKGKTFWVRAKEVSGWNPEFEEQLDEDSEPEDDIFGGVDKPNTDNSEEEFEDENVVLDTVFDDGSVKPSVVKNSSGNQCNKSDDPFDLYLLLNKNKGEKNKDFNCSESLKFPPGFTPSVKKEVGCNMDKQELNCDNLNGGASNQGDHVNA